MVDELVVGRFRNHVSRGIGTNSYMGASVSCIRAKDTNVGKSLLPKID